MLAVDVILDFSRRDNGFSFGSGFLTHNVFILLQLMAVARNVVQTLIRRACARATRLTTAERYWECIRNSLSRPCKGQRLRCGLMQAVKSIIDSSHDEGAFKVASGQVLTGPLTRPATASKPCHGGYNLELMDKNVSELNRG
jgi:hypothetical protein